MDDASALITAAKGGDSGSLRRLLDDLQRSLRLTAAIFLPTLRDVDALMQRLGTVVAESLATAPADNPVPWLRGHLRALIVHRLDELERTPAYAGDPLGRLLVSSGRERLARVPADADPVGALNDRLRFMAKGATDLLTLRFSTGLLLAQIAEQRRLSLDDVSQGLQTACRQLDWTGDASGGALEPADYRAIDGLVCGSGSIIEGLGLLRTRVLDDMGLALRAVRAARLHLIAAAWYAPALTFEIPALVKPPPAVPARRPTNPQVPVRVGKTRGFSTPTRRQVAQRDGGIVGAPSLDAYPEQHSRSSLIPTLIGGALVLGGVLLLFLRGGSHEPPAIGDKRQPTTVPVTPATGDQRQSATTAPTVAAPTTVAPDVSPSVITSPPTSKDWIVGEVQEGSSKKVGYQAGARSTITGNSGAGGSQTNGNVVMGYRLPTLPTGTMVTGATFRFEVSGGSDGLGLNPGLDVYLLKTANPDTSGTSFFYHGPAGSDRTNATWVGSTFVDVGRESVTHADDQHDVEVALAGEALSLLQSFYGGDHVPDQAEAFFRFSLNKAPVVGSRFVRYNIDIADDESSLTIQYGSGGKPLAPSTTNAPGTVAATTARMTKPLFPEATVAPIAAWSTRRLVADYQGPLLRVRRSSDNSELDIAVGGDGDLDRANLGTFAARSDAHVVVWYDQSGNGHHLRQGERTQQPRIIVNGTLLAENSRPVIVFERSRSEHLSTPAGIPIGCLYALVKVVSQGDATQAIMGSRSDFSGESDAYYPIVDRSGKGLCEWWVGQTKDFSILTKPITRGRLLLWHSSLGGPTRRALTLRLDGKEVAKGTASYETLVAVGPTIVGGGYWADQFGDPFGGSLGELIVLPPDSGSEVHSAITRNLKEWWKTP